jgi:methylated-DNA-[protein]-cysteine S-methyltransferase
VVSIWVENSERWWFGVAHHDSRLVATAIGRDRATALLSIGQCVPRGLEQQEDAESSAYARAMVRLLAALEGGSDELPSFELCPDCVTEPLASVLRAASSIPRGWVTSYGNIAAAAHTEARVVGHVMATNPLYPIVACHRVVGADMALVGYTGRQDAAALRAKLGRLKAEARGLDSAAEDQVSGMVVYPVERVIERAAQEGIDPGVQLSLW